MASRLERLLSIDTYIRAGNYPSVQKLAELFEVQARTIYQDLRELRELFGLDIQFDRQRNGYFNSDPTKELPQLAMTSDEGVLVTLAIELLAAQFGPSFRGALSRTLDTVKRTDAERFSWLRSVIDIENRANCEVSCTVLLGLFRSAKSKQRIALTLDNGGAIRLLDHPINVQYSAGHWVLVGNDGQSATDEPSELVSEPVSLCSVKFLHVVNEDGTMMKIS